MVHPSAVLLPGATVTSSVIGAGATIGGGSTITQQLVRARLLDEDLPSGRYRAADLAVVGAA